LIQTHYGRSQFKEIRGSLISRIAYRVREIASSLASHLLGSGEATKADDDISPADTTVLEIAR
jgi:hypothetical protein